MKTEEVALWPDDRTHPTKINRYLIDKNGEKAIVVYWYQSIGRVIASEYWGKIYLVMDTLRTGRRDGAIVRFFVPMLKGSNGNAEAEAALQLARATAPFLPRYIPD